MFKFLLTLKITIIAFIFVYAKFIIYPELFIFNQAKDNLFGCNKTRSLGHLYNIGSYFDRRNNISIEPKIRNIYSQFLHSYLGAICVFMVLFGISIFLYCARELLAQPQERREGQGTAAKQCLAAVPCPPLRCCC
jgi:hypothetical protein